ncbi:hypothetical protein SLS64_010734 [Diaporthe eres]
MEAQDSPQQSSLALLPKLKNVLRKGFPRRRDTAPQAPPQDQAVTQRTQQKSEPAATQFHRFPDLPTELRLKIWNEATRYKRYVVLDPPADSAIAGAKLLRRTDKYAEPGYAGERRPAWTSRTPPPTLLSVSREAREVALRTWQLAFGLSGKNSIPRWLRPYSSLVTEFMVTVWIATPDVEKIQRIVACGNFVFAQMRGMDTTELGREFMPGLKSLTMVKVGDLRWHFLSGSCYEDYGTTRRSRKGSPLLSLDGIDFVKAKRAPFWTTESFAEMEILDFVGGSTLSDIRSRWTMGPEASAWVVEKLPRRVHLGPQKKCMKRERWHCYTTSGTDIWYAI